MIWCCNKIREELLLLSFMIYEYVMMNGFTADGGGKESLRTKMHHFFVHHKSRIKYKIIWCRYMIQSMYQYNTRVIPFHRQSNIPNMNNLNHTWIEKILYALLWIFRCITGDFISLFIKWMKSAVATYLLHILFTVLTSWWIVDVILKRMLEK